MFPTLMPNHTFAKACSLELQLIIISVVPNPAPPNISNLSLLYLRLMSKSGVFGMVHKLHSIVHTSCALSIFIYLILWTTYLLLLVRVLPKSELSCNGVLFHCCTDIISLK